MSGLKGLAFRTIGVVALAGVATFTQTGVAAAATNTFYSKTVYTSSGGKADSRVTVDTTRHQMAITSWVTEFTNAGQQSLRACVELYSYAIGSWTKLTCKQGTAGSFLDSSCGATCVFGDAAVIPSGWYQVKVKYGWYTTAGWFNLYGYVLTSQSGWIWV